MYRLGRYLTSSTSESKIADQDPQNPYTEF